MTSTLADRMEAALAARQSLIDDESLTAYRIVNGAADGMDGLIVERVADVLIVQLHEGRLRLTLDEIRQAVCNLHEKLGTRAVYQKRFARDRDHLSADVAGMHKSPRPWIGEPVEPERTIAEHGLRFVVRPYDGFAFGLFLDHRDNRQRIRELAAGRRVLNAFSYTGGFSVAAATGAAAIVASVDLSKRYLEWAKQNFAANNLDIEPHRFFCSDIFDFYKRAERQNRRFDLIVLDPPTFSRTRRPKRTFVFKEQLEPLCAGAIRLLDPGGIILLATHDRQIPQTQLEAALAAAATSYKCTIIERPNLPTDFANDPDYSKTLIAQFD